jgi:hypothetical protein
MLTTTVAPQFEMHYAPEPRNRMRLLAHPYLVAAPSNLLQPYKHPASIAERSNGDLYIAWYGGQGEYAVSTAVWGTKLRRGESRWSDPQPIACDPLRSVGNAVVWQGPDGTAWLFYVVR